MNWSPVVRLRKRPVHVVAPTKLKRLRAYCMMMRVMDSIMPLATIAAPKHIAEMMSQMVLSIPDIPPVEMRLLSDSFPVSIAVEP